MLDITFQASFNHGKAMIFRVPLKRALLTGWGPSKAGRHFLHAVNWENALCSFATSQMGTDKYIMKAFLLSINESIIHH